MPINNTPLYDAVIAGVAASNQAWLTDPIPADYLVQANIAAAIATRVDALIPLVPTGATVSQRIVLESITKAVMSGRFPSSIVPADYTNIAQSIAAMYIEMCTKLLSGSTGSGNAALLYATLAAPFAVPIDPINWQTIGTLHVAPGVSIAGDKYLCSLSLDAISAGGEDVAFRVVYQDGANPPVVVTGATSDTMPFIAGVEKQAELTVVITGAISAALTISAQVLGGSTAVGPDLTIGRASLTVEKYQS
jgi:hypothetical protein